MENCQEQCPLQFLDCICFYDIGAQIISLIATCIVIYKCIQNLKYLFKERKASQDSQYRNSVKRKIIVNIVQIKCLIVLIIEIALSIGLFILYLNNQRIFLEKRLNGWYKFVDLLFINFLNSLNLTVGFLYWKAIRGYYIKSEQYLPWMFASSIQGLFWLVYFLNIGLVVAFGIYLSVVNEQKYTSGQVIIISIVILIVVSISTFICLYCRIYYYLKILCNVRMSESAFKKQRIYSLGIFISGFLRIFLAIADFTFDNNDLFGRSINCDTCLDTRPYRAFMLLGRNILINLISPFIFSQIFTTLSQQMKTQASKKNKLSSDLLTQ